MRRGGQHSRVRKVYGVLHNLADDNRSHFSIGRIAARLRCYKRESVSNELGHANQLRIPKE